MDFEMGDIMKKEELNNYKKKIGELSLEEQKLRRLYLRKLSLGEIQGPGTGYLSIDKPWLKYYSEEAITSDLPEMTAYQYMCHENVDNLSTKAISYFEKEISFKKYIKKINRMARKLQNMGVKAGDVVTVMSVCNPEVEILFYALNKIGAVINLIDVRSDSRAIKKYVNEVKSDVVMVMDNFLPEFDKAMEEMPTVKKVMTVSPFDSVPFPFNKIAKLANDKDDKELSKMMNDLSNKEKKSSFKDIKNFIKKIRETRKKKNSQVCDEINSIKKKNKYISFSKIMNKLTFTKAKEVQYKKDSLAVLVHTGGTTGIAKTVKLSNDNLNAMAVQYKTLNTGYNKGDTFLNGIVPFVAYGVAVTIHMPMCLGITNIIAPILSPEEFTEFMIKYKPNHTITIPSYVDDFIDSKIADEMDWSCIKHLGVGGDSFSKEKEMAVNKFLSDHGANILVEKGYGMTELSSSAVSCIGEINKLTSLGIPLPMNNMGMFDEDGNELQYGNEGEICISGKTEMLGYLNNEEEEKLVIKKHIDGVKWVHSGDLGVTDEDGFLYLKGRIKRMIIHGGFKLYPALIEGTIVEHPDINNCCVITIPSKEFGSSPEAHVVLKEDKIKEWKKIKEELIELCKEELPDYSQPVDFIVEEELPLTVVGKVDYKKLERKRKIEIENENK